MHKHFLQYQLPDLEVLSKNLEWGIVLKFSCHDIAVKTVLIHSEKKLCPRKTPNPFTTMLDYYSHLLNNIY